MAHWAPMSTPPLPPPAPVVPHLGPPGLPVAVTAALWSTELLAGRVPVDAVVDRAAGPADSVTPELVETLTVSVPAWGEVGERVVVPLLPRPGRAGLLPVGPEALGAGTAPSSVGVLVAPSLGEGFVLHLTPFGHALDGGWLLDAERVACRPVPHHAVEQAGLRAAQRGLAAAVRSGIELLETLGAPPVWAGERAGGHGAWSAAELPRRVPPEVLDLLERAAAVAAMTTEGRETHAAVGAATAGRHRALTELHHAALDALEAGSLSAARGLSGNRSGTRD